MKKYILKEDNLPKKYILAEDGPSELDTVTPEKAAADKAPYDWAKLFKERPGQRSDSRVANMQDRELWEVYYKTEWGDNKDKVKKLGLPFQEALIKISFNKEVNPFCKFIEGLLANKECDGIFDNNRYVAIHNAAQKNFITENQLKNAFTKDGSAPLTDSLLNWPELYTLPAQEIYNMLELSRLDNLNKINDKTDSKALENKWLIGILHNADIKLDISQALKELNSRAKDGTKAEKGPLRTMSTTKDLYTVLLGDPKAKKENKLANKEDVLNALGALPKDITSAHIIAYLIISSRSEKFQEEVKKQLPEIVTKAESVSISLAANTRLAKAFKGLQLNENGCLKILEVLKEIWTKTAKEGT